MRNSCLVLVLSLVAGSFVHADDWPQFRGPDRTGVSKEKGLLKAWPKEGPKLAWTYKNAGLGFSTVSVVKGVVYTLGTDMKFNDGLIIAIDEKTGAELWTHKIGPMFSFKGNTWGDGPRSTPTIDGNLLFALGGQGELICLDLITKKELWRKNLIKDLNGEMMTKWGYSESPLVDGDLLICTPGGKNGNLAALEKKTGKLVWQTKDWTELAPYSSPIVAEIQGVRQYIQTGYTGGAKGGSVAGVDLKGKVLWRKQYFTGDSYNTAPTPIVQGNLVYATEQNGCQLFDINAMQVATEQYKALKAKKKVKNNHGGVVLIDGKIYGHTDPGGWICQDLKTGAEEWLERNQLKCNSGATTAAEGLLYFYTDEGEVGLVDATPKGFNLVSSFTIPVKSTIPAMRPSSRESKMWAHPVIANGHLYLRDNEYIFAFKITK